MTKEDKELLLKDLCARLPYNTMIHGIYTYNNPDYDCGREPDKILHSENDSVLTASDIEWIEMGTAEIKPYLFPLSSMTDEQEKEFSDLYYRYHESAFIFNERFSYDRYSIKDIGFYPYYLQDWLDSKHFDYRGLIEMGLAIDASNLNIY